jgi:acetylornithine/succinyldiaminopimelate/putrescine aminotransferase
MNLLDALPNGGPPDARAPWPPTVASDLSLNVDGARPARLDRWREVEVTHRRLLEARGLLSAYARAAAELLMMEASPSHRLEAPPLLSAPVKDQWSVSIHEKIIRFHPRDASAWVVDCCADRSTSVLGHHHPVALQALHTFVESRAPAMPFGLLFMKPAAKALVRELELVAAAAEAEAAELPRTPDGTPLAAASSEAGSLPVEPRRWTARLMHSAVDANEAAIRLCLIRWQLCGALAAAPALTAAEPPLPLRPMAWFKQRAAAREEEESAAAAESEAALAAAQIKPPRSPTDPKTFLSYGQIRALLLAAEVPRTELFGASTVGALQRIASLRALDLDHLALEHADVLATSDSELCRNQPPGMRSAAECEGDAALARARAAIVAAEAEVASLESARAAAEKLREDHEVWRGEVASTAASETHLGRLHSEIAHLRSELEETSSSAPPTAPSAAPSAASSSMSNPSRAEDGLNPNARLAEEDGVLHGPTASSSPVAAAAPAATAPFGTEEPLVPVVLVVEGAEHGQSWLLRGLPTGSVHVHVLPASVYEDVEALPWLLEHFTTPSWAAGAGVAEAEEGAVSSSSFSPSPLYTRTRAPPARRRCAVAALLIEPVSGQTGACLTPSVATALQAACDAYGVPIISDETRAALGRCGPLLCGFALGLHAHVVTVGEALGAGYASVAAVMYDTDAFAAVRAFPSTSTMANDNLGSHMGLAVLAELQRTAADVRFAAERFERAVRGALKGNPAVRAVRGRGLLLGVTFSTAAMAKLRVVAAEGIETAVVGGALGERAPPAALLLHVYLLRAHSMRSRPSGVDPATLMVELPAVATDESIARVSAALKYVADLLRREAFGVVLACWLMPWLGVQSSTPTRNSPLMLNQAVEPLGGDDGDDDDEMASAHASAQQEAAAKLQAVGRGKADRAMVADMKDEKAAGEASLASLRTTSMAVQQPGWEQGSPGPGWIAWTNPRGSPTTAGWGAAYRM